MEWIIFEILAVLVLGLAIVWWTAAPSRRRRDTDRDTQRDGRRGRDQ